MDSGASRSDRHVHGLPHDLPCRPTRSGRARTATVLEDPSCTTTPPIRRSTPAAAAVCHGVSSHGSDRLGPHVYVDLGGDPHPRPGRACTDCHAPAYSWIPTHGDSIAHVSTTTGCGCHDTDLLAEHAKYPQGSDTTFRCTNCHASTNPQVQTAIANGNTACSGCHQGHNAGSPAIQGDRYGLPTSSTNATSGYVYWAAATPYRLPRRHPGRRRTARQLHHDHHQVCGLPLGPRCGRRRYPSAERYLGRQLVQLLPLRRQHRHPRAGRPERRGRQQLAAQHLPRLLPHQLASRRRCV